MLSIIAAGGVHNGAAAPAQAEVENLVQAAARGGGRALGRVVALGLRTRKVESQVMRRRRNKVGVHQMPDAEEMKVYGFMGKGPDAEEMRVKGFRGRGTDAEDIRVKGFMS